MTQSAIGGPAQTIYQVTDRKGVVGRDAVRVVQVTDGRPAEGGPQQAAYFVSDAEIASGEFIVTGNKPLAIVKVDAQGAEYPPIAVYDVTGKANDVQPSQDVYTLTVATSGSGSVSASPSKSKYASGDVVTLTATPGGGATFSGWSGDASGTSASIILTINGDKAITATFEGGALVLPEVASATLLLDLRAADLSDGAITTWSDRTAAHNDFSRGSGSTYLEKHVVGGYAEVQFNPTALETDWMLGPDFADNFSSALIVVVAQPSTLGELSGLQAFISKINNTGDGAGWIFYNFGGDVITQEDGGGAYSQNGTNPVLPTLDGEYAVFAAEFATLNDLNVYWDNIKVSAAPIGTGGVANTSTAEPVRLGRTAADSGEGYLSSNIRAIFMYTPAPNASDRVAIIAWAMEQYGISEPSTPIYVSGSVENSGEIQIVFSLPVVYPGTPVNYAEGVTIKKNGTPTIPSVATTVGTNTPVISYSFDLGTFQSGDTVTWEYDAEVGHLANNLGNLPVASITAKTLTNPL